MSILGISWFWFFGASLLTLLPNYCKEVLYANEYVVTFLLSVFCIGMALGALLCARMSGRKLELGLVPFGSIGMTLFVLDLFLVGDPYAGAAKPASLLGLGDFFAAPSGIRITIDMGLLAIFGGFYTGIIYFVARR